MKRGRGYRRTLILASIVSASATTLIGSINGIAKVNPVDAAAYLSPLLASFYNVIRLEAPLFLIVLTVVGLTARWGSRQLGPPWLWEYTQGLLDEYQKQLFTDRKSAELGFHCVTLFRHTPWCWRRAWILWEKGWLIPVQRSGHTAQKSSSVFRAPDSPDHCEGIAGQAWGRRTIVSVHSLPDLSKNPGDDAIREYATRTGVDEKLIRKQIQKKIPPKARSIVGMPIDTKKGVWGVLVMDSREPEPIQWKTSKIRNLKVLCAGLGKLLEGARQ